jgi:hypothetical protein
LGQHIYEAPLQNMVKGKQSFPIIPPQAGAWDRDGDSKFVIPLPKSATTR